MERYWTASKCRLDRWGRSLREIGQNHTETDTRRQQACWPFVRAVLEEVLTSEMLTRVWTAVLCAHDRGHGSNEAEPIARSVMIGHLEARHRVLTLLVHGATIDAEAAVKLNHLRRRTERWTDMLVGYLSGLCDVREFSIDPLRAQGFAEDLHCPSGSPADPQAWALVQASLRSAFQQGLSPNSPNPDLNAGIASSILSCFPAELFDSTGLLHSLWWLRLSRAADDAQGMIDDLLSLDRRETPGGTGLPATRPRDDVRRFRR